MAYNSTFHKEKRDINIYQCCNKASYGETHKQKHTNKNTQTKHTNTQQIHNKTSQEKHTKTSQ